MSAAPPEPPASPVLAVGAVVEREGSLLLVRRGRPPSLGLWSVPGGRVERGESLDQAVRREVLEETGLAVEPGELLGWVERLDGGHHFVILDFLAALERGDDSPPVPGDDAAEARFVLLSEVRSLHLAAGLGDFLAEHGVC